jgi:hypothetical protein
MSHCTMQNNSLEVQLLLARQIMFIYDTSVIQRKVSSVVIQGFILIICPAFSYIPFQSCMLRNVTSRPTLNSISHRWHAQIFNRNRFLYTAYCNSHENITNTDGIKTIHWNERLLYITWPTIYVTFMQRLNAGELVVMVTQNCVISELQSHCYIIIYVYKRILKIGDQTSYEARNTP